MRFFENRKPPAPYQGDYDMGTWPTETNMEAPMTPPEHADATAVIADARAEAVPDPRVDPASVRADCPHCMGTGTVLTVSDLLRTSLSIATANGGPDPLVRTFYSTLVDVAPDLAALFPGDLTDPDSPPPGDGLGEFRRTGRGQRDKLVGALIALANSFDPDDPTGDRMLILRTHLRAFGRAHAAFARPNGTVRGATLVEYGAVRSALFDTLMQAAGDRWRPEFTDAWDAAYDFAARWMIRGQCEAEDEAGPAGPAARFPRA